MTMAEMALFLDDALALHAELKVVPALGWRRSMWFDETGLPWVKPSPNIPNLTSALLYPDIVAFEGTNVSVGRGTSDAFQRFGAPWLNATAVVARLEGMRLPGLRFEVDSFTPRSPGDNKYGDRRIAGVHISVVDRNAVESGTLSAAMLSAIHATTPDSLRVNANSFDERFGSPQLRLAILRGENPLALMVPVRVAAQRFAAQAHRFYLYQ